jgi:hypothetical protein
MRLLPTALKRRLLLLTPARLGGTVDFGQPDYDPTRYNRYFYAMQRLRGRVYLDDGAIDASALTADGRHCQTVDHHSWHVLSVDGNGRVWGCARYRQYPRSVSFGDLGVSRAELARTTWGAQLRHAVTTQIRVAQERGMSFVEVGGWALHEEVRYGAEALRIALATFGLADLLGGCIGLTTATVRHGSSTILRKIGGMSLGESGAELPKYFDPRYGCEMEILRFDSSRPNPRYADMIRRMEDDLSNVEVLTPAAVNDLVAAAAAVGESVTMRAPMAALSVA